MHEDMLYTKTQMAISTFVATPSANNDILQMMREELSGEEQLMFAQSFHMYLQCDNKKDFVIDLDDVYKWLGFKQKGNAMRIIFKCLKQDVDFVEKERANDVENRRGGQNKKTLIMTVWGFKKLCLSASTDEAMRVCEYYVDMEAIMMKYVHQTTMERAKSAEALLEHQRSIAAKALDDGAKAREEAATAEGRKGGRAEGRKGGSSEGA